MTPKFINSVWCTNHGPATSIYYTDPDGNQLECLLENFNSAEDAVAFMDGPEFNENLLVSITAPKSLCDEWRRARTTCL
jgi:hypothetical protein